MCSSPFTSNAWRTSLIASLDPSLSVYDSKDYRRFLSAHLHFLTGLCQLAIRATNDSVRQFLSSPLIAAKLLPDLTFQSRINTLIDQSKASAPIAFAHLLSLLRDSNHGNAIVSAYGTNFKFMMPLPDSFWGEYNANNR